MGQVPKCYFRLDASNDMQNDLLRSPRDLDLTLNFQSDLSKPTYIWFDSTRDKGDGTQIIAVRLEMKKLLVKNDFAQKQHF